MSATLLTAVERSVRKARRRLVLQRLVNALAVAWVAALAAGLGWVLAEPWVLAAPPDGLRWAVLGGAAAVGTVAAVLWAVLTAPSRELLQLLLDSAQRLGDTQADVESVALEPSRADGVLRLSAERGGLHPYDVYGKNRA